VVAFANLLVGIWYAAGHPMLFAQSIMEKESLLLSEFLQPAVARQQQQDFQSDAVAKEAKQEANSSRKADAIELELPIIIAPLRTVNSNATTTATTIHNTHPRNMTFTNPLGPLLDETVRLLFRHNATAANEYIHNHPGSDLKIYIYDNDLLPEEFQWQYSADCMNPNPTNNTVNSNCDWGETLCGVVSNGGGGVSYVKRRFNRNGDVVLSKLFAQYHGPSRTYDPDQATLLIVPFPSQAHFHCKGAKNQKYYDTVQRGLIDKLKYLTPETKHKHVFFSSSVLPASNKWLRSEFPLVISLGFVQEACRQPHGKERPNCGHIVMPYVNMNPDYQPNLVATKNFKPIRERQFSVVAKLNTKISGRGADRVRFKQCAEEHMKLNNGTLVNRPMMVGELSARRSMGNEVEILETYRDTIFCPCLRGDEPPQKRFFDVILSGCLPVVLEHPAIHDGHYSWFAAGSAAIHDVFPFATRTFYGRAEMGIEYSDFVVSVNGTCGSRCILPHLEHLLLHEMDKLQAMQDKMKEFARLFSFGMAENSFTGVDAVSSILVSARHYVNEWKGYQEQQLRAEVARLSMTYNQSLASTLDDTVRILLPSEAAEKYVAMYPGSTFKFYVYEEELPEEYQWLTNANCLDERLDVGCDWGESFCEVNTTNPGLWMQKRSTGNGDLILSKAFAQYRGPARTYNPDEADIFVVPWPSNAHTLCRKTDYNQVKMELIDELKYFNESTKNRHVFFASGSWVSSRSEFSLVIGTDPVPCGEPLLAKRMNCGKIVAGYVNTGQQYQPGVVLQNFEASIRDRQYSMVAVVKSKLSAKSAAAIRQNFLNAIAEHNTTIASRPLVVVGRDSLTSEAEILQLYRNSVFCPILRGERVPQKLFFDAIISGCLPVVLKYEYEANGRMFTSHFANGDHAIHNVYPFAKGSFYDQQDMGIDYNAFFVAVNGTCGTSCIIPTLDDLLVNQMDKLQAMQDEMKRISQLLTYGMMENTWTRSDAVSALLVQVRHYYLMNKAQPDGSTITSRTG
jgi:hypothetical protein